MNSFILNSIIGSAEMAYEESSQSFLDSRQGKIDELYSAAMMSVDKIKYSRDKPEPKRSSSTKTIRQTKQAKQQKYKYYNEDDYDF